jgi:anti-sigma factor RsiW
MKKTCCDQLVDCLSDYIDGELPPELVAQLDEHILTCTNCRIVVDTTKKTISLYHQLGEDQHVPNSVVERLHKTLDISNFLKE